MQVYDPIILDVDDSEALQKRVWDECHRCSDVLAKTGSMMAAAGADPGLVACPKCGADHWSIGAKHKCTQCGFVYLTDWWPMLSLGKQAGDRHDPWQKRMSHPVYSWAYNNADNPDVFIDLSISGKELRRELPWDEILKGIQP